MSKVIKCEIADCSYNVDNCCCTMAITIGNSMSPKCDTFCQSAMKGGQADCRAGVGSCKTSSCMYNSNLECCAPGVCIGYKDQEPDCLTFQAK